jgi:hypothetical protein
MAKKHSSESLEEVRSARIGASGNGQNPVAYRGTLAQLRAANLI